MRKQVLSAIIIGVAISYIGCTKHLESAEAGKVEEIAISQIVTNEEVVEEDTKVKNVVPTTVTIQSDKIIKAKNNNPYWNKNDLTQVSNISYDRLYSILEFTSLADLTSSFIKAEEFYGVNALAIVGIVILESGWGNSSRARNDNNLTGYAIYNRGSSYGFSSKEESIMRTTQLLKEDYLTKDGKYYNGKSLSAVNIKYCESNDWHIKVNTIVKQLLAK